MASRFAPFESMRTRLSMLSWHDFMNLRGLGFALARAWVYLMFLGAAVSSITWNGDPVPGTVFLASTATLAATLFLSALFHRKFEKLMQAKAFRFLGPALTTTGTLLVAFIGFPGTSWLLFCILGAVSTGIGSGIIDLGYGELYRSIDPLKTSFEVPFSFFLAAALFPLVLFLPSLWACVVCALLPAVSGWILFVKLKAWSPQETTVERFEIHIGKFAWRIGLCACLVGISDGVVRAVFMTASATTTDNFYRFPLFWASILTLIIVYSCVLFSREVGLRYVYKSVMLVMALFFMLLPVFTGLSEVESTIALAGYGTFNAMIWLILVEVSYTFRFSSVMVFGIGWGMVTLGVLLGSAVGQIVSSLVPPTPQSLSLIALIATLAILVSYMFVFKESDLIELTKVAGEDDVNAKRPRFQERCKEIAEEYRLSPKETEIMILFAKGRSSARIQEDLYLSRGTVTTHLRHIYQKLDVHNKQEFLDLIEGRNSQNERSR